MTVKGGCNCHTIRFKIAVPALEYRPIILSPPNQSSKSKDKPTSEVHLPMITIDHWNDCRRGTGSLMNFGICTPTIFVSFSCLPRSKRDTSQRENITRGPWTPASEIYAPNSQRPREDTYVALYKSSDHVTGSLFSRCGTSLAVSVSNSLCAIGKGRVVRTA